MEILGNIELFLFRLLLVVVVQCIIFCLPVKSLPRVRQISDPAKYLTDLIVSPVKPSSAGHGRLSFQHEDSSNVNIDKENAKSLGLAYYFYYYQSNNLNKRFKRQILVSCKRNEDCQKTLPIYFVCDVPAGKCDDCMSICYPPGQGREDLCHQCPVKYHKLLNDKGPRIPVRPDANEEDSGLTYDSAGSYAYEEDSGLTDGNGKTPLKFIIIMAVAAIGGFIGVSLIIIALVVTKRRTRRRNPRKDEARRRSINLVPKGKQQLVSLTIQGYDLQKNPVSVEALPLADKLKQKAEVTKPLLTYSASPFPGPEEGIYESFDVGPLELDRVNPSPVANRGYGDVDDDGDKGDEDGDDCPSFASLASDGDVSLPRGPASLECGDLDKPVAGVSVAEDSEAVYWSHQYDSTQNFKTRVYEPCVEEAAEAYEHDYLVSSGPDTCLASMPADAYDDGEVPEDPVSRESAHYPSWVLDPPEFHMQNATCDPSWMEGNVAPDLLLTPEIRLFLHSRHEVFYYSDSSGVLKINVKRDTKENDIDLLKRELLFKKPEMPLEITRADRFVINGAYLPLELYHPDSKMGARVGVYLKVWRKDAEGNRKGDHFWYMLTVYHLIHSVCKKMTDFISVGFPWNSPFFRMYQVEEEFRGHHADQKANVVVSDHLRDSEKRKVKKSKAVFDAVPKDKDDDRWNKPAVDILAVPVNPGYGIHFIDSKVNDKELVKFEVYKTSKSGPLAAEADLLAMAGPKGSEAVKGNLKEPKASLALELPHPKEDPDNNHFSYINLFSYDFPSWSDKDGACGTAIFVEDGAETKLLGLHVASREDIGMGLDAWHNIRTAFRPDVYDFEIWAPPVTFAAVETDRDSGFASRAGGSQASTTFSG